MSARQVTQKETTVSKLRSSLTYPHVMSTLALFIALGGGAYAISIGKNDVKSRHIQNGAVKSADVKDDGLKGKDIVEASLDTKAFTAAASTPFAGNGADQPIACNPNGAAGALRRGRDRYTDRRANSRLASGEMIPDAPLPGCAERGMPRLRRQQMDRGKCHSVRRRREGFLCVGLSAPIARGSSQGIAAMRSTPGRGSGCACRDLWRYRRSRWRAHETSNLSAPDAAFLSF